MIERLFEVVDLERNTFKLIHSELIQQVQCVEFNLKRIYAAMCQGDFDDNFHSLDNANLGKIVRELKRLDHSDGCPELTDMNYKTIDEIRMIRNYWCINVIWILHIFKTTLSENARFKELLSVCTMMNSELMN